MMTTHASPTTESSTRLGLSSARKLDTKSLNGTSNDDKNHDGYDFGRKNNPCAVLYSHHDIVHCVDYRGRKNMTGFPSRCQTNISTWEDVKICLHGPNREPLPVYAKNVRKWPSKINLIGERNSGTKFLVKEMQDCFSSTGITIERDWNGRNKHFFQRTRSRRSRRQRQHIIVVAVRDPVDWVAAMIEKPYHMIEHMKGFDKDDKPIPLDWKTFVNKPWTMPNRSNSDYELLSQREKNRPFLPYCRTGMRFDEVIPCRIDSGTIPQQLVRAHFPVYELRRGYPNVPYNNILELRSEKIVNMVLEVPLLNDLGGFLVVRFEDVLRNGTRFMLEQVAEMIGLSELPTTCHPQGPRPEIIGRRAIPDGLRQWVNDHLNVETERLLGYRD